MKFLATSLTMSPCTYSTFDDAMRVVKEHEDKTTCNFIKFSSLQKDAKLVGL